MTIHFSQQLEKLSPSCERNSDQNGKNDHIENRHKEQSKQKEHGSQSVMKKIAEGESSCQNRRMNDAMLDISNGHFLYS